MRGLVMILMTVDHASEAFNAGRVFSDSVMFWKPGSPLPTAQFLTRWITHLCAPTFVFLAGAALAMSSESRRARGDSARSIDAHIAKRGALLVVFEFGWMSWVMVGPGRFLGQVLYALGASLLFMVPLRRLGDRLLLALGLGWIVFGELAVRAVTSSGHAPLPMGLLVSGGFYDKGRLIVAYPAFSWLAIMAVGWVFGRRLVAWRDQGRDVDAVATRVLAVTGVAALAVFAVVRGIDGYGNMMLHREGSALVQWLHVSKYPPSVTFDALELGIMAIVLAGFFAWSARRGGEAFGGPVRTIGQTALFYYLLHIHALHLLGRLTGLEGKLGLLSAYAAAAFVLVALYPLCVRYRRFKAEHPRSFAQYI